MDENHETSSGITHSPLSCYQCRRLKRRCDRQYPCCNLCQQKELACDYPYQRKKRVRHIKGNHQDSVSLATPSSSSSSSNIISPQSYGTDTFELRVRPSRPTNENVQHQLAKLNKLNLVTASFLDPDNFILAQLETERTDVIITKHVAGLVGSVSDIQDTARTFWESAHLWIPIISKEQFQQLLLQRLVTKRAQLFLLVLGMKLLSSRTKVAKSMLYQTVKQFYFDVESMVGLSLLLLQSYTLITLYELGHGIYPAAIISVAHCAHIGTLLGIDKSLSHEGLSAGMPWVELEERRRLWWAILTLDRFMNLSYPKRPLVTLDPDPESYLPVDDDTFDSAATEPGESVQLHLSSQVHLGRFARFVHAVPLLSQAIRRSGEDYCDNSQLRRTILSLIHLGESESVEDRVLFCTLNAVCYLAVFALDSSTLQTASQFNQHEPTIDDIASPETMSAIEHAIRIMSSKATQQNSQNISPFVFHMIYKALTVFWRLQHVLIGVNISGKIKLLNSALELLKTRWLVAETYLLLSQRQEIFSAI